MEALPPAPAYANDDELIRFGMILSRGQSLHSLVSKLPNELVLEAGLSARKSRLLERWVMLESPGLDGIVSNEAFTSLSGWNHEAEVLVSYLSTFEPERPVGRKPHDGRVYSGPIVDPSRLPQVLESLVSSDFVSDRWCWPWPNKKSPEPVKSSRFDKGTLVKLGVLAGIGTMAAVVYFDEEE